MASTIAMYTGLSGLNANARNLDVIGNNIANVNTTAFKSNRMLFASQFSRNISLGSAPGEVNGGSNPAQIGLGTTIGGTQRNFSSGSLATTGDSRDLAIEGEGFFIVSRGTDSFYTRAGAFRQNSANELVTISGERLMGYGVDADFNITPTLTSLSIAIGERRLAEATENVHFTGNLDAGGTTASRGARYTFAPITGTMGPLTTASLLTDIDEPVMGGALFTAGEFIEIGGVEKGGRQLPSARLEVTATTTLQDYLTFLQQALGIDPSAGANPDGFTPGASFDAMTGIITITGNVGSRNDIELGAADIRRLSAAGAQLSTPFSPTRATAADGESVRTTFVVYDSLGNAITADLTMTKVAGSNGAGTTWRYQLESADDSDVNLLIGGGTVQFDQLGRLAETSSPITATINRAGVGSAEPGTFNVLLSSTSGTVSALSGQASNLAAKFQDGAELGILSSFSVGANGIITGSFSNGRTRPIGQVALAKFANPEGLVDVGSNLFKVGPNSGTPIETTPTLLGAGRLVGGALEQSNVDLAEEFIKLIQATTGYSASSRVITTTDQLFQQLLVLGR
ncbi:MAG: flagellar hook-basal body complex protein [Phycisphaerae bacterium]|nr:flagellar hook-basal body complex protein [Phycisphaerae bacterium]